MRIGALRTSNPQLASIMPSAVFQRMRERIGIGRAICQSMSRFRNRPMPVMVAFEMTSITKKKKNSM